MAERITLYRDYDDDANMETVSVDPGSPDEKLFRGLGFGTSKPKGRPPKPKGGGAEEDRPPASAEGDGS